MSVVSKSWSYLRHCKNMLHQSKFSPDLLCRCLATRPETILNVFDRKAKRMHRDRVAKLQDYKDFEIVKEEIGYRTYDRLCDIKREFDVGVELSCGRGYVSRHILKEMMKVIYQCDMSEKLLRKAEVSPEVPTYKVVADEEFIPFKDNSVHIFFSCLSLHWVNDLPGCFKQVQRALKPDGVFLGSMFGGETLYELRVALQLAEQECEGGFGPHISPFADANDLGNLLNRAGFTMLTLDVDEMQVTYPDILELMHHLQGMAENNCAWNRKAMIHRNTLEVAENKYKEMYGTESGLPATYQIVNFIGWKPDPSQPKPAKRGSQDFSLKDLDRIDDLVKEIHTVRSDDSNDKNNRS